MLGGCTALTLQFRAPTLHCSMSVLTLRFKLRFCYYYLKSFQIFKCHTAAGYPGVHTRSQTAASVKTGYTPPIK